MPSTFSSPTIGSAYFYRRRDGHRTVCRSTGFELLYSLQVTLRAALENLGALPTAGGGSITFDQIDVIDLTNPTAGPGWDDTTLRALYAYTARGARSFLPDIAADIMRRSGTLSLRTMKAAMWALDSQGIDAAGNDTYGLGSPDEVSFDSDTVFPQYAQIPPMPQNRAVAANTGNCTPIAEGAVAGDPITTTASFGVDVGLVLLVLLAGVVGIANATKKEPARMNPWLDWNHRATAQKKSR